MQIEELYEYFIHSSGISTDTRRIEKGNLFFALKGENYNGNLFALEALASGASLVIADENQFPKNDKIVVVDNVLERLQRLANHHRRKIKSKVIAIGGSNGKTTTKELLARVLETTFKTFATKGNLNNHIGVPLTILSIASDIEISIIEMGANHIGETAMLCDIAEPDCGLITNNGKDHLEGYGSLQGVKEGNGELYEYLKKKNGLAFISADQHDLIGMSSGLKRIFYGENSRAEVKGKITELYPFLKLQVTAGGLNKDLANDRESQLSDKEETTPDVTIETQLIGKYNFDNSMAAVCIAKYFGVADEKIQQAISTYIPSDNRSQVLKKGSNTFLLDAYNANPSSMVAALENFALMPVKNKVVILGDMLELGNLSEQEHVELILNLADKSFDKIILVGDEFENALSLSGKNYQHFATVAQLKDWFDQQQFSDCFFLLKGSRLIGLEKLLV